MPFHRRQWNVVDVETPKELSEIIGESYHRTPCTGYRCQGILWLNDNAEMMSPDSVNEWAVVREKDGRQCESVTVGWSDPATHRALVLEYQAKYAGGAKPQFGEGQTLQPGELDHPDDCRLCA